MEEREEDKWSQKTGKIKKCGLDKMTKKKGCSFQKLNYNSLC